MNAHDLCAICMRHVASRCVMGSFCGPRSYLRAGVDSESSSSLSWSHSYRSLHFREGSIISCSISNWFHLVGVGPRGAFSLNPLVSHADGIIIVSLYKLRVWRFVMAVVSRLVRRVGIVAISGRKVSSEPEYSTGGGIQTTRAPRQDERH